MAHKGGRRDHREIASAIGRNAVAVICATAVGKAVIVDRRVPQGNHFMAGEISYVLTDSTDALSEEKTQR